ncbi:hypothetical protein PPO22_07465 [Proteus mirabilis]|uniref:hypothetical protein n=1 Tax=Proteus mirabilis TaxID=584 RepID=UPI0022308F73|nr:hypothetical protein [Proteus mirabilis]MDC5887407.1 hypothetical protein [Proteus mirabilis]MDC5905004.1 hypothetical protein [Proteus mirabilis]MDC5922657.1 hypothetical protein [Proteus mirabilis]MDC5933184.1 hypothetical protein [Proteus mirabilis]MDC5940022.1 hypothetical protein [Proteus mirabilis]
MPLFLMNGLEKKITIRFDCHKWLPTISDHDATHHDVADIMEYHDDRGKEWQIIAV